MKKAWKPSLPQLGSLLATIHVLATPSGRGPTVDDVREALRPFQTNEGRSWIVAVSGFNNVDSFFESLDSLVALVHDRNGLRRHEKRAKELASRMLDCIPGQGHESDPTRTRVVEFLTILYSLARGLNLPVDLETFRARILAWQRPDLSWLFPTGQINDATAAKLVQELTVLANRSSSADFPSLDDRKTAVRALELVVGHLPKGDLP